MKTLSNKQLFLLAFFLGFCVAGPIIATETVSEAIYNFIHRLMMAL